MQNQTGGRALAQHVTLIAITKKKKAVEGRGEEEERKRKKAERKKYRISSPQFLTRFPGD
jgi:hypothetical protein